VISCSSTKSYYASQPAVADAPSDSLLYSFFLIGDTGDQHLYLADSPLNALRDKLLKAGTNSAVVFLGDNIYPAGLPAEGDSDRKASEEKIIDQLTILQDYPGRIFYIPGNHDWSNAGRDGLQAVRRMEDFIESYLDRGNVFLPDEGYPGPVDVKLVDKDTVASLTRDIHLVALDTHWWLHPHEKPFGDTGEYELHDSGDFLDELHNVMLDRQNDHLLVVGHHPLFSNGVNGGNFPLRTHLLPPVGGSAYVLYRKFFGYQQDIAHFRYQSLKRELLDAFEGSESLVYASGHDHILQHTIRKGRRQNQHYIISGTGSETHYASKGKTAEFVAQKRGFAVIQYYADYSSWVEFWNNEGELLYRRQLLGPNENPFVDLKQDSVPKAVPKFADSTVTVAANPTYADAGWVQRTILGSHNRSLWAIPIEAPVFDISTVRGGLQPEKLGGTGQTYNLRLRDKQGNSYVLRSIDKEAGRVWDATLRNTFAEDLAQDQFSIINPYGAFMMPPLAEAVQVYHTRPELYLIPDDPRLGRYADVMAGKLALFEERPDDDMSHALHLSGSEDVLSTRDLFIEVDGDLDHRVDQRMMLRNRLLDMLISDWDRHEDQWRWASFEPADEKGKIYQPIPRDRDMAFMFMNGFVPTIGKISFFKHYQDFRTSYGNLKGLTDNSLDLTRRFTNQLTKNEWHAIADSMKAELSDSVIEKSVAMMPETVAEVHGETIAKVLKERRDKLPQVAMRYYNLLSRIVDVVGSHKREKFVVESYAGDSVRVQVYKVKKDGDIDRKYFDRTFYSDETRELRLFGLGGDDLFEIQQLKSDAITIRIVGGAGGDEFTGALKPEGQLVVYDNTDGSTFRNIGGFKFKTSDRPAINAYDYKGGFNYNTVDPLLYFGSNRDDGIYIGAGAQITRHGFRKKPAAAIHRIRANFAAETEAFNVRYSGHFAQVAGRWDATLNIDALLPNNIRNFYGLGNETTDESRDDDFYQARLWQYQVRPALQRSLATGISFSAGPFFQVTQVKDDQGRFIGQPQPGISENTFDDQWFTGIHSNVTLQSVDDFINPMQGFRWNNNAELNIGVQNTSKTYSSLSSALSIYWSPILHHQLTLATRFGIEHNIGSYPFYDANTLGGKQTLRGLLSNRYAGRTSFYNNIETRTKLFDFQNYLLGGEMGVLGFVDHGRVWTDGESSDKWHFGAGGGLWMSVFNMAVIRGSIGFSEGSYNILVGAGFFF
jgi:hypothetical protein